MVNDMIQIKSTHTFTLELVWVRPCEAQRGKPKIAKRPAESLALLLSRLAGVKYVFEKNSTVTYNGY